MPLLRYFVIVGGCLLLLLFAADAYLPKTGGADNRTSRSEVAQLDRTTVRISSAKQSAPPIVYDTSRSFTATRPIADNPPVGDPATATVVHDGVRNAYAQIDAGSAAPSETAASSKISKKRSASRKHQQKRRALAQAREPGFFDFW